MTSIVSNIFGSVIVRLGLIFGALAVMTTAAIAVAWLVFQSIASNMALLSQEHLPELQASANVVTSTDAVRDTLLDVLVAGTTEELDQLARSAQSTLASLRENMGADSRSDGSQLINNVEASLVDLTAARKNALDAQHSVATKIKEALGLATSAIGILDEASDSAYFDLVLGGDATIETVEASLTQLIESDFALYQSVLAVQSEMNLLSGVSLSRTQTTDRSVQTILADLATAADKRLKDMFAQLAASETTQDLAEQVSAAHADLMTVFGHATTSMRPTAILSIRQEVDAALSAALDDIYFELVIKSEDTKDSNKTSIRALLDEQVAAIRDQAALNASTKSFVAAIFQVALSRDAAELDLNAAELALAATQLVQLKEAGTEEIMQQLAGVLAMADPETGIGFARATALDADQRAFQATQNATAAVGQIATVVAAESARARAAIEASAAALNRQVNTAQNRMQTISLLSILLVLAAPVLIWWMITGPLNRVTRVTERLAEGDLSEITELTQKHGEIGRLSKALQVFRNGALERIQLQADEKRNHDERIAAERAAEQAKHDAEQQAWDAKEARAKEDQEREARALAREEEIRLKEDRARAERAREQELVVSKLADGLHRLSLGDLTFAIDTVFPEDYEALRRDYNTAVASLSAIIENIGLCADTIDQGSAEIAAASTDLASRTEQAASTLEQTSATLNVITQGVSSSAQAASNAAQDAEDVTRKTEQSRKVMTDAVQAMQEIEDSSSEIGKIIGVIDAIAFQTNLLALNAGVEAARAGEAGTGFAVVASEVRQLAHRSTEAADQIKSLVSVSTSQVENGVTLLAETSDWLDKNLDDISKMSGVMKEIASSSDQQSRSLSDINRSVEMLDGTTQKNAAMFEQTTAANQSLTEQARKLIGMVSGFSTSHSAPERQADGLQEDHGGADRAA